MTENALQNVKNELVNRTRHTSCEMAEIVAAEVLAKNAMPRKH